MTPAKTAILEAVREFGGDALRDLWVFDTEGHEALFLRPDVAAKVEDVDVESHIDNERFGYVTRDTYNQLYYAEYAYTIRGFDRYEQYRTFVGTDGLRVGLFASFDRRPEGYNFRQLDDTIRPIIAEYDADEFRPADDRD